MRLLLILAACVGVAFAQETDSNMACVERLQMPVYPPLAAAARIPGTVMVTVAVGSDGSAQTKTEGRPLLIEAVEKAIKESKFRASCGDKSVKLIFDFVLDEVAPGKPQRVSFGYPNHFWITVTPPVIEPQA